MRNKQVWTFPVGNQSLLFPRSFHLNHRFTSNQTFKSLLPFSGSIGPFLLLLCLSYIEQNILMNAGNHAHLLHKLLCSSLHVSGVINFGSQRI
jgi:hypothetical protein